MGVFKQTFTNRYGKGARTLDDKRKAKPPGKRISKKGKTYYESRKNRSDTEEELSRYRRYRTVKNKKEVLKERKREKAKVKASQRKTKKKSR